MKYFMIGIILLMLSGCYTPDLNSTESVEAQASRDTYEILGVVELGYPIQTFKCYDDLNQPIGRFNHSLFYPHTDMTDYLTIYDSDVDVMMRFESFHIRENEMPDETQEFLDIVDSLEYGGKIECWTKLLTHDDNIWLTVHDEGHQQKILLTAYARFEMKCYEEWEEEKYYVCRYFYRDQEIEDYEVGKYIQDEIEDVVVYEVSEGW